MDKVRYYYDDEYTPKAISGNHIGVNIIIKYNDDYLLEHRSDDESWGLIGGGLNTCETLVEGIIRECLEETGILLKENEIKFYKIFDNPSRIIYYSEEVVKRIISVVYFIELTEIPAMKISKESKNIKFFSRKNIEKLTITNTHIPIIEDIFKKYV